MMEVKVAIKPSLTYNFRQKMPVRNQGYDICFHSFRICQFLWTFLSFVFSLIFTYLTLAGWINIQQYFTGMFTSSLMLCIEWSPRFSDIEVKLQMIYEIFKYPKVRYNVILYLTSHIPVSAKMFPHFFRSTHHVILIIALLYSSLRLK